MSVETSKDALPWRLTGATLNVHNRREASLVVSQRDDARIHAPTSETVIHPPVGYCKKSQFMITGEIKSQIDALWNAFWTGGISNPLEVIEQITYMLFLKRLDDLHTLGGDDSTYAHHMKDARFTIPTPALLAKVVALTAEDHKQNNLPDILARWRSISNLKSEISNAERVRLRIAQSFCVPKADIAAQGYDLSLNRYKEVVHENVTHRKPDEILKALDELEKEIQQGMKELKEMLK